MKPICINIFVRMTHGCFRSHRRSFERKKFLTISVKVEVTDSSLKPKLNRRTRSNSIAARKITTLMMTSLVIVFPVWNWYRMSSAIDLNTFSNVGLFEDNVQAREIGANRLIKRDYLKNRPPCFQCLARMNPASAPPRCAKCATFPPVPLIPW